MQHEFLLILKNIYSNIQFSEKEFEMIQAAFKPLTLKKGEFFCKKNQICDKLGILLNGTLYAYFEAKNSNIKVSRFYYLPDNVIVSSFESFKYGKRSSEFIRALEDCQMLCISSQELNKLFEQNNNFNSIGRSIAEDNYINALQRIHELQALDGKARLENFLRNKGHLFEKVSGEHIASYLGMTPTNLRRVRKKINRQ